MSLDHYRSHADSLCQQYDQLEPAEVHRSWLDRLPKDPGIALDLGAGSGRDAHWLAEKGWDVIAVEPCDEMRERASAHYPHPSIQWLNDSLPELKKLRQIGQRFNLILVSAVWMHLPPSDRERAFRIASELLAPGGLLVITLRQGPDDGRGFFDVPVEELLQQARRRALALVTQCCVPDLKRKGLSWHTVVLQLPDDGSGSLPLLRHIIVNDNKSATYKLGLLRAVMKIAEGAPGMVLARTDDHVDIPFGLVGLFWLKMYLPLINRYELRQSTNKNKGYGFAKDAFYSLAKTSIFDLRIGARVTGEPAKLLHSAIQDACANIQRMPAHYITYPGTSQQVFSCDRKSIRSNDHAFSLDKASLATFGTFRIPTAIWQCMGQYACWLEPVIVQEWQSLMIGYEVRYSMEAYANALRWDEGIRDTNEVRRRAGQMTASGQQLNCVWTAKKLRDNNYAIDHCFPWSRWGNNDLWNLMPATEKANLQKSDKLPSAALLHESRPLILNWWQEAFLGSSFKQRFLCEAEAALPLVSASGQPLDNIFEGVLYQRSRLKANQQLPEWTVHV